jgi:mismatch-specific thymine-DNA glycosylase
MPLRSSSTASKAKKEVVVSPYFKSDRTSHGSKGFSLKSTTFQSKKELREEDELIPVPDILDYNLRVLFVGINGGITSSKRGHHFASPTNHFWPCLSASGQLSSFNIQYDFFMLLKHHVFLQDWWTEN